MKYKLIVALDFNDQTKAMTLIDKLDPNICALKVGSEMYTLFGPTFVRKLVDRKFKVFLDLKFHDIPTTVAKACSAACELGVWMLNVHAAGGFKMLQAARASIDSFGKDKPLLIAVSVLTSMETEDLLSIGITTPLDKYVIELSKLALQSGFDGVVSSALEVPLIKKTCGDKFITVTPGIRMPNDVLNDQLRVISPKEALNFGSDYLVVGRPITLSSNPLQVIDELFADA